MTSKKPREWDVNAIWNLVDCFRADELPDSFIDKAAYDLLENKLSELQRLVSSNDWERKANEYFNNGLLLERKLRKALDALELTVASECYHCANDSNLAIKEIEAMK